MSTPPFWQRKTLEEMTQKEWESICDGCGRCCLVKLEDADTGDIAHTTIACRLFDDSTCRCSDYKNRNKIVSDCYVLTPKLVGDLDWLPGTCAYRMLDEGKDLAWWHPLVSGSPQTVHEAGISVRGSTINEAMVPEDQLTDYVVSIEGAGAWRPPQRR